MKEVKLAYDYLFFTFYRFWEKAPSRWLSNWKAVISISVLNIFALLSIYGIVMYKLRINLLPNSVTLPIIIAIIIFGVNYFYFLRQNRWRNKIDKFDAINSFRDKTGILIIISLVVFLVAFLVYSVYLISTVDWQDIK